MEGSVENVMDQLATMALDVDQEHVHSDRFEEQIGTLEAELDMEQTSQGHLTKDLRQALNMCNTVPCHFWVQSDRPNLAYDGNPRNRSRPSARSIRTS